MAQNVPTSIALHETAFELSVKGRFARAAEKFDAGAAAAAEELLAEDCLAVAYMRAAQADALTCHSLAPTLTATERFETRKIVTSVLLPQCVSTLTRRKAAGTLLPGSCRAEEVAWWRAKAERKLLHEGHSVEVACAGAEALGPTLGFDAYMVAANVAHKVLFLLGPFGMSREVQLWHAAFVASALDSMADPCELPSIVVDNEKCMFCSTPENLLAQSARQSLLNALLCAKLDVDAVSLLSDAWRRVERSGAIAMRELQDECDPGESIRASYDAAAAEAAARGLRKCALPGCAAKEVHVSHFKRCGACRTVAYCCREHQATDWPAHKAACKAARKAVAPSSE